MNESFIDFINKHKGEDICVYIEPYLMLNEIRITMRRNTALVRRVLSCYELYLMTESDRFSEILDQMYNEFDMVS